MTTSKQALPGYTARTNSQPWGVWDRHLRRWLVEPIYTDRGAWVHLLGLSSLHPWELEIRQLHAETGKASAECEDCYGDGTCITCGQTCPTCDGDGEVSE